MKNHKFIAIGLSAAALMASSCSDERWGFQGSDDESGLLLQLSAEIDQISATRADNHGFADGDRIGVYAVNYEGEDPGQLKASGNLADNVRFIFDEQPFKWIGDRDIYFQDNHTKVDIYGIYPYASNITDVDAYAFSVRINQSNHPNGTISDYEASDLLWGKVEGAEPGSGVIDIRFSHIMAGVAVNLVEGEGFGDGEWNMLDKRVFVGATARGAKVNLSTGEVRCETPGVADKPISANYDGADFRAIVVPQTVAASSPLLILNVGDKEYTFRRDEEMVYSPSKLHKFTIKVDKKSAGGDYIFTLVQEAITPWECDANSHSGDTKQYVVVNVEEYGGLESAIKKAGLDASKLVNLKVTGRLIDGDFEYMREKMTNLEAVNLQDCLTVGRLYSWTWDWDAYADKYHNKEQTLPISAFENMKNLKYVILPSKLRAIGQHAFKGTSLAGHINFPEGVEYIGSEAFRANSRSALNGELHLPSTLIYIGGGAFYENSFSGELVLPPGVKYIGDEAFARCYNMKGELHLPENLEYLGASAFYRVLGLGGQLIYPSSEKRVRSVASDTKITSVRLPGQPEEFEDGALRALPLSGDFVIPASVRKIGSEALAATNLSHVYFAPNINLQSIPFGMLGDNHALIDTITFPESTEIIEDCALIRCEKLDAVVIPKRVVKIGSYVFENCSSLSYIRCDAVNPPDVPLNAFSGVNKDNFTIEVPEESVDAYRSHPVWGEFKRISVYKNFVARPMKYNLLNKGGNREIVLNADGAWEVVSKPDWCTLSKTSGTMKTSIQLTVSRMAHNAGNREGKIVFRMKDRPEFTTSVNVGQYDCEYEEDGAYTLQTHTKGAGVNLFFVGDGYDAVDISSGKMLADFKEEIEAFFDVEPYRTYRDYFNVYFGVALSDDSGIEDVNHWRKTKFHTAVSNSDTRLETDWVSAFNFGADAANSVSPAITGNLGVILVVNTPLYEGVTYLGGDGFCSVVTRSEMLYPNDARGIIQHEAGGHGIGWLGDEYVYHRSYIQKCPCNCCNHVADLEADHAAGFALNLSLNGKYREVPWKHLMAHPDYHNSVDIYEGGYFHSKGVYRSEFNSCMNNNVAYFSAWSRQLIVERISKLAGVPFSLDAFYQKDVDESDRMYGTRSGAPTLTGVRHGRTPVRVKNLSLKGSHKMKGGKK